MSPAHRPLRLLGLHPPKRFFLAAVCLIMIQFAQAQVVINEWSASNKTTIQDNNNQYEDWFELYNAGAASVNIGGYHLSDKPNKPTKWVIPNINLPAGGHVIFYASGRDQVVGANYHTSFKLQQTKNEYIVLADAGGMILDSIRMIPAQIDHSRGRTTDGAATWSIFTNPTPGAANANAKLEYASKPVFSIPAGFYPNAQNVTITSPDPNTEIRYTLDGKVPKATSLLYTGPINVSSTTSIRARCYSTDPNIPHSFTETNTYLINVTHTLPVITLAGDSFTDLFDTWGVDEIMSCFEFFDVNQVQQFELEGDFRGHGNDSWAFDQKGIRFYARDDYGYDHTIHHQLFWNKDRDKFDVLILRNAGSDNYPGDGFSRPSCHIRDAFVQSLSQKWKLHVDERTYQPCIVYINGQFWGIYEMRERIDGDFTEYYYDQPGDSVDMLEYWGWLNIRYGSDVDWVALATYMDNNSMAVQANYDYVKDRLNIGSFIDYFIVNTYLVNTDWLNWNTKWWRGRAQTGDKKKWRYTMWDMDNVLNLGENYTGLPTTSYEVDPCAVQNLFNGSSNIHHTDMFNQLSANPQFFADYINRYADLMNTALHCDTMLAHLDSLIANIQPEMPQQIATWGGTMQEWQDNITFMKNEITGRCGLIDSLLVGCYQPDITGPYEITVLVDPPGAGTVTLNSLDLNNFPWTGTYFGGIDLEMEAIPDSGWVFAWWEADSNTVLPAIDSISMTINLSAGDTIIAHFVVPDTFNLTVDVEPPLSGDVSVNSFIPPSYPYTDQFGTTTPMSLKAQEAIGYRFIRWEPAHHNLIPNNDTDFVTFSFAVEDTIIAVFEAIPDTFELTVLVDPPLSGDVDVDTFVLSAYPWSHRFQDSTLLNIVAHAALDYRFDRWEMAHHTVDPNNFDTLGSFSILQQDTLIAHFEEIPDSFELTVIVEPPLSGSVDVDTFSIFNFPWVHRFQDSTTLTVVAFPEAEFTFNRWELFRHTVTPSDTDSLASFVFTELDTLIAHFDSILPPEPEGDFFFPNAFSPNGDGNNDVIRVYGGDIVDMHLVIYNRWGERVFESKVQDEAWDGTYNGKALNSGVFAYKLNVQFLDGTSLKEAGNITLVR